MHVMLFFQHIFCSNKQSVTTYKLQTFHRGKYANCISKIPTSKIKSVSLFRTKTDEVIVAITWDVNITGIFKCWINFIISLNEHYNHYKFYLQYAQKLTQNKV